MSARSRPSRRVPERPEHRWPAFIAVLAVIVADAVLPSAFGVVPRVVVPTVAGLLALALLLYNPTHFNRETRWSRTASILMSVLLCGWNIVEVVAVVGQLITGSADPKLVLLQAFRVWATGVVVFALVYWELDREGPVARRFPPQPGIQADFRFPQEDVVALAGWQPTYIDYLYTSLSTSMAFSPTDAMPLRPRAKGIMAVQALIGFVLMALVISRAVNILG